MIDWVTSAIENSEAAYMAANASPNLPQGQILRTWASVWTTLNQWRTMVITNGGAGGGRTGGGGT